MRNLQLSYLSTTYLLWLRNNLYPVLYENIIHKAIIENFSLTEVQFYTHFCMRTLSTSLLQTTFHWLRYNFIPSSVWEHYPQVYYRQLFTDWGTILYPVLYENIIHKSIRQLFTDWGTILYPVLYENIIHKSITDNFHWLRYNFIPWSVKMFTLATFISMSDLLLCKKERQFCQVTLPPIYM